MPTGLQTRPQENLLIAALWLPVTFMANETLPAFPVSLKRNSSGPGARGFCPGAEKTIAGHFRRAGGHPVDCFSA